MLEQVRAWEREEIQTSNSEMQNLSKGIKVNEERMNKLVSTYLDGDIPKVIYLKQKDSLMRSSLSLKEEKKDFASGRNKWVEPLKEWILDRKQATFLSSSDNFSEIAHFVKKVGTNPTVRDKTAHFATLTPRGLVVVRYRLLSMSSPLAMTTSALSEREVSCCGE